MYSKILTDSCVCVCVCVCVCDVLVLKGRLVGGVGQV